jgi:hypothetical protein
MRNTTSRRLETQTDSENTDAITQAPVQKLAPWSFLTELGRQQMAVATESTSAIFRGNEALRKIQHETAHEASVRHAEAAQKLFSPCQPGDLLSIQSELLRTDMQSANHYWQQLAAAAMQTQREMMTSMTHLLDSDSGGGMKSAMKVFQATTIPAMAMTSSFLAPKPESTNVQSTDA